MTTKTNTTDLKKTKRRRAGKKRVVTVTAGVCRVCGCTDADCRGCIERTGMPCSWVDAGRTLCSACDGEGMAAPRPLAKKALGGGQRKALPARNPQLTLL